MRYCMSLSSWSTCEALTKNEIGAPKLYNLINRADQNAKERARVCVHVVIR